VAFFSDRREDDLVLESILHDFQEIHDAELLSEATRPPWGVSS
jgi:hypothetical protein